MQERAFQQFISSISPTPPEEMIDSLREFFTLGWQGGQALWNVDTFDEWWNRDVVPNQPLDLPNWFIKLARAGACVGWQAGLRKAAQQGG
ncbi:MAG: hypothetical protein ACKO24_01875 [Leptolyngbyaceae cyanobacterium]